MPKGKERLAKRSSHCLGKIADLEPNLYDGFLAALRYNVPEDRIVMNVMET